MYLFVAMWWPMSFQHYKKKWSITCDSRWYTQSRSRQFGWGEGSEYIRSRYFHCLDKRGLNRTQRSHSFFVLFFLFAAKVFDCKIIFFGAQHCTKNRRLFHLLLKMTNKHSGERKKRLNNNNNETEKKSKMKMVKVSMSYRITDLKPSYIYIFVCFIESRETIDLIIVQLSESIKIELFVEFLSSNSSDFSLTLFNISYL